MFGYYTDKRLTQKEQEILWKNPDDYTWYMVIIGNLFKDYRFFQVREDIKLPYDDGDGVVLIFEDGSVVYFKTLKENFTNIESKNIFKNCVFLEDEFNCPIDLYIACSPDCDIIFHHLGEARNIRVFFSFIGSNDAEEVVEKLESKVKNNEFFTVEDSINHMLLPFWSFKDKTTFDTKYQKYMEYFRGD